MPTRQSIRDFIDSQCTTGPTVFAPTKLFRATLRMWAADRGHMPPTPRLIASVLWQDYEIKAFGKRHDWAYKGVKLNPQQCWCGEMVDPGDIEDVRVHIRQHGGLRWTR